MEKRRLFWRLDTGNKVVLNSLSHLNFGSQGRYPVKDGFFRALPEKGGWGALLQELHFWSTKGVCFFQNANDFDFEQFLGCLYTVFLVLNWLSSLDF